MQQSAFETPVLPKGVQTAQPLGDSEGAEPIAFLQAGNLKTYPKWARQLGRAARAKALAEFDERIVIERTLAVYQSCCRN